MHRSMEWALHMQASPRDPNGTFHFALVSRQAIILPEEYLAISLECLHLLLLIFCAAAAASGDLALSSRCAARILWRGSFSSSYLTSTCSLLGVFGAALVPLGRSVTAAKHDATFLSRHSEGPPHSTCVSSSSLPRSLYVHLNLFSARRIWCCPRSFGSLSDCRQTRRDIPFSPQ